jgi:hypothetical protein
MVSLREAFSIIWPHETSYRVLKRDHSSILICRGADCLRHSFASYLAKYDIAQGQIPQMLIGNVGESLERRRGARPTLDGYPDGPRQ